MDNSIIQSLITTQHKGIHCKLDHFLTTGKIPNIIFHGSAGTGKKTIIFNFLNKIYGNAETTNNNQKELISILKNNVMSVNCCHGKGIKFIREELKFFSKINIQHAKGVYFKSIVLFNADCLTIDAQSALRRCIELFSHNTRFFIVVENIHKLLKPIVSRFCEIYVPQIMIFDKEVGKNKFINLHQYQIDPSPFPPPTPPSSGGDPPNKNDKMDYIHSKILPCSGEGSGSKIEIRTPADWTNMVDCFYERGISAIDILAYLKTMSEGSVLKETVYSYEFINSIELEFHKLKGDYKNEKLLMFRILWFIHNQLKAVAGAAVAAVAASTPVISPLK